jgi:hypothetical protein
MGRLRFSHRRAPTCVRNVDEAIYWRPLLDQCPRSLFGGLRISTLRRDGETTELLRGPVVPEAFPSFPPLFLLESLVFLVPALLLFEPLLFRFIGLPLKLAVFFLRVLCQHCDDQRLEVFRVPGFPYDSFRTLATVTAITTDK